MTLYRCVRQTDKPIPSAIEEERPPDSFSRSYLLGARQAGKVWAPEMPLGPHEGLGSVPLELLQPRLCRGWAVLPISHACVLKSKLKACVKMHSNKANKAC